MGLFLLAHSNLMKLYGDKGPQKLQLVFELKCSDGIMSLVSNTITVEKFSRCTIPPWISLMIWRKYDGSKSNNIVL